MRRHVLAVLSLAIFSGVVALCQTDAPVLTDLETCQVDVSLLNETIVRLKIEKADLERRLDLLQLQIDRERRTPPAKEGYTWSWQLDSKTGRPTGYVKVEGK